MKILFNFKARKAGMTALTVFAVTASLILLNLLVQNIPAQWDMTRKKLFSLSSQSKAILNRLDEEVNIYLLSRTGKEPGNILEALESYPAGSSRIKLKVLDPDRNPGLVKKYSSPGKRIPLDSIIVAGQDFHRIIDPVDLYNVSSSAQGKPQIMGMTVEQQISSALEYIITGKIPKVYALRGHGEFPLKQLQLKEEIRKANYENLTLNLLKEGQVPQDADALLILNPRRDITEKEGQALDSYLNGGGAIFAALDFNNADMRHLYGLFKRWNIEILPGLIMEKDSARLLPGMGNNPLFFAPFLPKDNPITTPLKEEKLDVFLFKAMGLRESKTKKKNLKWTVLLSTSPSSWLREDLSNGSEFKSPLDISGPVTAAAAIARTNQDTGKEEGARLVVMTGGSSLGIIPGLGQIRGNTELVVSSLNWLCHRDEDLSIPSKSLYRLPLRLDALRAWIYAFICVVFIPLVILITGLIILIRRKHL